jgi:hypothetical protein
MVSVITFVPIPVSVIVTPVPAYMVMVSHAPWATKIIVVIVVKPDKTIIITKTSTAIVDKIQTGKQEKIGPG